MTALAVKMSNRNKQLGMSSLGLLLMLAAVGFVVTCLFKMAPSYLDNRFIVGTLQSLADSEDDLAALSNGQIRSQLSKTFVVNNVRNININDVQIERMQSKVLVNIDYEVRVPLFYNVDVVMTFENQLDSSRPGECCSPPKDI